MSETTEVARPVSQPLIPPFLPRMIHRLAVPIVLLWLGLTVLVNVAVPQLEVVSKNHAVSQSPKDAPGMIAMKKVGSTFGEIDKDGKFKPEFNSDSSAMIVLEGDKPLGTAAHQYYGEIVKRLKQDTTHVQHIQDFWNDPLTAAGSQSTDGKAAYVQVYLAGNMGESLSTESTEAVRKIVNSVPAPPGIKPYVTGAGPLIADQSHAGEKGVKTVTLITFLVIIVMLLFVYRSVSTVFIVLFMVMVEVAAARGVVAFLGNYGIIGLSTFANNLLVLLAIAAGTDYAIFIMGRYHEARGLGEDREQAFYTMYHGTAHVVLGSGLTIAGAMYCLSFTRLPYFQSLGAPCAVGMLVAVLRGADPGPGGARGGQFLQAAGSEADIANPRMATHRHRDCPLARADSRGDDRDRPDRSSRPARIHNGLRQPPLFAVRHPGQRRLCSRRPTLQPSPAESRAAHDRDGSRHAQSGRLPGVGQGGKSNLPHPRYRPCPDHHPAPGHSARPQHTCFSAERAKRRPDPDPALPGGAGEEPAEASGRAPENDGNSA